jgi:hypothetical protein
MLDGFAGVRFVLDILEATPEAGVQGTDQGIFVTLAISRTQ